MFISFISFISFSYVIKSFGEKLECATSKYIDLPPLEYMGDSAWRFDKELFVFNDVNYSQ